MRPNDPPHIAVIGAGLAGLTAARLLHDRGYRVRLFDKGRSPGGRLSVRRHGHFAFDHGAQYFTVRDQRLADIVRTWSSERVVAPWSGRVGALEKGTWRDTSALHRYVGIPGMNALAKHTAEGLNLTTATRVAQITQDGLTWRLLADDGSQLASCDILIVATPAAQAATLLDGHGHLATTAHNCTMQPCWAVMLGFDQPISMPYDAAFIHDSCLAWIARNSTKPGRPPSEAWVLHATPGWSSAHIDDPPADILANTIAEFSRLLDTPLPKPAFSTAHRWRYASVSYPLDTGALWDAARRLAVCGDWCHGGRIEGAFLSGQAAAQHILDHTAAET